MSGQSGNEGKPGSENLSFLMWFKNKISRGSADVTGEGTRRAETVGDCLSNEE